MPARPRSSCSSFLIVPLALTLAATPALAQPSTPSGPRATVTGIVADPSGAVLVDATVEALAGQQVVARAATGRDGRYRIDLPSGARYQLRVTRDGFAVQIVELPITSAALTRDIVMGIAALADDVVVTASRLRESRATTTESIAVLTAREIEAMGAQSLADIVRAVPGLNVESNGREGALASLFSRGGESDYNLVLIDGVRVNASGGPFDFSRVSAADIERVEIVRGAQSALYGSDAIGSVVQIFTRRAGALNRPEVSGSVEAGSFGTMRGDVRLLGGARGRADYHAGVSYRGTDGAFADILPETDRYDETTFNGGVGVVVGESTSLGGGLRYSDARGRAVGPIAYGARDTGTLADTEALSWHLEMSQRLTSRLDHTATVAYFRSSLVAADAIADPPYGVFAILEGRPGAIFPDSPRLVRLIDRPTFDAIRAGGQPLAAGQFLASTPYGISDFVSSFESRLRRPAIRYQANLTWLDAHVLSAGYEYERETDPTNHFLVANHAYFVQQRFQVQHRWFASLGARVNDNSRYGVELMPKLSLGGYPLPFRAGPVSSVKVFANIGKGIKNPTFGELFGSAFTDGNPTLHPERARTLDAGAEVTFDRQRWLGRVTYFDNRYRDQVAFRFTGFGLDGRPDFINIDGSKAHGWELEAALQRPFAGLTASAGYAFVDTRVVASISTSEQFQPGQPLFRRPRHSSMLRLAYARGRGTVHINLRQVGQRHDAAFLGLTAVPSAQDPTGRSVDITVNPGYTLLWLGGEVRLHNDLTLFVRVDNVTDETYESALGFPGLPRAAVVGARFTVGRRQ